MPQSLSVNRRFQNLPNEVILYIFATSYTTDYTNAPDVTLVNHIAVCAWPVEHGDRFKMGTKQLFYWLILGFTVCICVDGDNRLYFEPMSSRYKMCTVVSVHFLKAIDLTPSSFNHVTWCIVQNQWIFKFSIRYAASSTVCFTREMRKTITYCNYQQGNWVFFFETQAELANLPNVPA